MNSTCIEEEKKELILNEVIGKYIGRYVKLGGKSGFFYCGRIPSNFQEFFNDLSNIEFDKLNKRRDNILKDLKEFGFIWDEKKEKMIEKGATPEDLDLFEQNASHALDNLRNKLDKVEDDIKNRASLLSYKVLKIYPSKIDGATVIIIKYVSNGTYMNYKDMCERSASLRRLVQKYHV